MPAEPVAEVAAVAEAELEADATAEAALDVLPEPEAVAESPVEAGDQPGETPLDREAAMAAIQAAAEAAASQEAAEAQADRAEAAADRAEAAVGTEPASDAGTLTPGAPEPAAGAGDAGLAAETVAGDAAVDVPADAAIDQPAGTEEEIDPRLAMLGLTPDFAAAEMAAAEAAAAEFEEMPEFGGDALEARLAGLVPGDAPAPAVATVTTQLVVTGLVSVASIASFKRHVGRLVGVAHVGVSSGPDGEFLFSVEHDPATSLRELIPTLPGFGARVVGAGDGIVHVSAQDPQD